MLNISTFKYFTLENSHILQGVTLKVKKGR